MLSCLFFCTSEGEVLIEKQFREKIPRNVLEDYWASYVAPLPTPLDAPTVVQYSRYAFIQILRDDVVLLGVTTHEVAPMMIVEILAMIHTKLSTYLKVVNEENLKSNFSLVYQLLEELIDYGYPLVTEYHELEELVPRQTLENQLRSLIDTPKKVTKAAVDGTGISWRSPHIKYSSNELFFDLIEFMDIVVSAEGNVVRASVRGAIDCVCHLSGMPNVNILFRNVELLEDVAFHRCVRQKCYEANRTLEFVPPDGPFRLFQYRIKPKPGLTTPFYVNPQITFNKNVGRISCMVGLRGGPAALEKGKDVTKVIVYIPLPASTESISVCTISSGTFHFNPTTKVVTWKIGMLTSTSPSFSAEVFLKPPLGQESSSVEGTGEAVTAQFQVAGHNFSGFKISTVNIEELYKAEKWVKYTARNGRFSIRTV